MSWQEILVVSGQWILAKVKSLFSHPAWRILFIMVGYVLAAAIISALVSNGLSYFIM
jgi:hypothetical protein